MRALSESGSSDGVGRLSEKSLHKTIKYYLEPNEAYHEVKLLGSIADIKNPRGIYEVQTRSAYKLRGKIEKFLEQSSVCLVLPLAAKKTVSWVSRETGEISPPRKSTKSEGVYDALYELSALSDLLGREGFSVKLLFLDVSEYKYLGRGGKKWGAERMERIANSVIAERDISSVSELLPLISDIPKEEFSSKELSRVTGRTGRRAFYITKFLLDLALIERVGKSGRAFIYKRKF